MAATRSSLCRHASLVLLATLAGCSNAAPAPRLCDAADVLSSAEEQTLSTERDLLARELGVDAAYSMGAASGAGFETEAAGLLDRWRVGPDGRGLLLAYDSDTAQLRIEVGYALEALLPDALVGRWIAIHLRPLFGSARPATALRLTTRMLRDRVRAAELAAAEPPALALAHGSGGGGASGLAPIRRQDLPFSANADDPSDDRSWRAASSVRAAHARYRAWLAAGRFETDVALFTPDTRSFLAGWPMTSGYLEHILWQEQRCRFGLIQRGDAALLHCQGNPHVPPHFFRRAREGWQIDLAAEAREVLDVAGGRWSWAFRDAHAPALAPFRDALARVEGFLRLRDGDNRPARSNLTPPGRPSPASCERSL